MPDDDNDDDDDEQAGLLGDADVARSLADCWVVDFGQGYVGHAAQTAERLLDEGRSPARLLAAGVTRQLVGDLRTALAWLTEAFELARDDDERSLVAACALRCASEGRAELADGSVAAVPEAEPEFSPALLEQWRERFRAATADARTHRQVVALYIGGFLSRVASSRGEALALRGRVGVPPLPAWILRQCAAGERDRSIPDLEDPLIAQMALHRAEFLALAGDLDAGLERLAALRGRLPGIEDPVWRQVVTAHLLTCEARWRLSVAPSGLPEHFGVSHHGSPGQQVTVADAAATRRALVTALDLYEQVGCPRGAARCEALLAWLDWLQGDLASAKQRYWHASTVAGQVGDLRLLHAAYLGAGVCGSVLGTPAADLRAAGHVVGRFASGRGLTAWAVGLAEAMTELCAELGNLDRVDEALRLATLVGALLEAFDAPYRRSSLATVRARVLLRANALTDARAELAAATADLGRCRLAGLQGTVRPSVLAGQLLVAIATQDATALERLRQLTAEHLATAHAAPSVALAFAAAAREAFELAPRTLAGEQEAEDEAADRLARETEDESHDAVSQEFLGWLHATCSIEACCIRGRDALRQGLDDEAGVDFSRACDIAATLPDAHYRLALVYNTWRRRDQALESLRAWLDAGLPGSSPLAERVMQTLEPPQAGGTAQVHQRVRRQAHLRAAALLVELQDWQAASRAYEAGGSPVHGQAPVEDGGGLDLVMLVGHIKVARGLGQTDLALQKAYAGFRDIDRRRAGLREERHWRGLAGTPEVRELYALYVELLCAGGHWESAFDIAELDRAGTLMAFVQAVDASRGSSQSRAVMRLAAELECLAEQAPLGSPPGSRSDPDPAPDAAAHQNAILAGHAAAVEALEQGRLAVFEQPPDSNARGRRAGGLTGLARLRARVPEGVLVVTYHLWRETLHIWALTRQGLVARSRQTVPRTLAHALEAWAGTIECPAAAPPPVGLDQWLLAPVSEAVAAARHVVFVSGGALGGAPLHLLSWQGRALALQRSVSFLPAASMVGRSPARDRAQKDAPVLVVGEPAAMVRVRLESGARQTLSTLPSSLVEAHLVASIHAVPALVGDDASKEPVAAGIARSPRIVHLATHGFYSAASPLASGVVLAHGDTLTAAELLGERLSSLVVLSACDTAVGKAMGGESVGLVRSLLVAGTRAVIASLWQAPDSATMLLMVRLHTALARGRSPRLALALAQAWLSRATCPEILKFLERLATVHRLRERGPGVQAALESCRCEVLLLSHRYDGALAASVQAESLWRQARRSDDADRVATQRASIELRAAVAGPPVPGVSPFAHPRFWAPFVLFGL